MPEPPENHVHPLGLAAWRAWLKAHHARGEGVWLVRYKKATGKPTLSQKEITQEALCWGWVDSVPRRVDKERSAVYVAPRKPGSNWSALNKRYVAEAEASGDMTPAGRAKVDAAKRDGSWTALDGVEALAVPDDLAAALAARPGARAFWDAFPPSTRRGILEWVLNAKRPATRQKRIEETARLAERNMRANQWPREG